jgi:hypothetical protein
LVKPLIDSCTAIAHVGVSAGAIRVLFGYNAQQAIAISDRNRQFHLPA